MTLSWHLMSMISWFLKTPRPILGRLRKFLYMTTHFEVWGSGPPSTAPRSDSATMDSKTLAEEIGRNEFEGKGRRVKGCEISFRSTIFDFFRSILHYLNTKPAFSMKGFEKGRRILTNIQIMPRTSFNPSTFQFRCQFLSFCFWDLSVLASWCWRGGKRKRGRNTNKIKGSAIENLEPNYPTKGVKSEDGSFLKKKRENHCLIPTE